MAPIYTSQWLYPYVAGVNWELLSPTSAVYTPAHLTQHKPAACAVTEMAPIVHVRVLSQMLKGPS